MNLPGGDVPLAVPPPSRTYRLFSIAELLRDPHVDDLLAGIIPARTVGCLIGHPGTGKTFFALDLALSVAFGVPFLGREVSPGAVLYLSSEGRAGIPSRLRAWFQFTGTDLASAPEGAFRFVPDRIDLTNPEDIDALLMQLDATGMKPALFVIDTLSRCLAGEDENSAGVISEAFGSIDRLREISGASVLVLHHLTKVGREPRGSSAIHAAVDWMLALRETPDGIVLDDVKTRDRGPDTPVRFRLLEVPLETGDSLESSCVVVPAADANAGDDSQAGENESDRLILSVLSQPENADGIDASTIVKATRLSVATVHRRLNLLQSHDFCFSIPNTKPKRWRVVGEGSQGGAA